MTDEISDEISYKRGLPKYAEIMHLDRWKLYKEQNPTGEKGEFVIEEKVDGSCFRFSIDGAGNIQTGSKSINYSHANLPDKMFRPIVESMEKTLSNLYNNGAFSSTLKDKDDMIVFYAEYLRSPKHNALKYDRIPKNNLYLFDVARNGAYQNYLQVREWADVLDVEPVKVLVVCDKLHEYKHIMEFINNKKSFLGDILIEGVVIKNYGMTIYDNHTKRDQPFMIKVVRDEFKEVLRKTWKEENGKGHNDIVARVINHVNKNAVWDKALQHLREQGKLTGEMRDMKEIISEVEREVEKEWKEIIYKELYECFNHDIKRGFVKGLPEYYKEKIYNQLLEKVESKGE